MLRLSNIQSPYVSSMVLFVAAFVYFWLAAMPRYFETPAKNTELRNHAIALTSYYAGKKTVDKYIDGKVADDMRDMMIDQLSNAIEANRPVVERRLAARSRTILLLLAGFAFICLSEMLIFAVDEFQLFGVHAHASIKSAPDPGKGDFARTPHPAQSDTGTARR